MKTLYSILIVLLFANCKAQTTVNINTYNHFDNSNKYFKDLDGNYPNFVGTWENTTNGITFRLTLWSVSMDVLPNENNSFMDTIYGRYLIVANANTPNETILFNSTKYFPQNGYTSNWVLMGSGTNSYGIGGFFSDTNANNGTYVLNGAFSIEILNLGTTPLQAHWILRDIGQKFAGDSYTVPTDCILTKVN